MKPESVLSLIGNWLSFLYACENMQLVSVWSSPLFWFVCPLFIFGLGKLFISGQAMSVMELYIF